VASAYKQGCAAIALDGQADQDKPRLIPQTPVDTCDLTFGPK